MKANNVSDSQLAKAAEEFAPIRARLQVGSTKVNLDMPPTAAYGYLAEVAKSTDMPLGWSYLAALTISAGRYSLNMNTQGAIRTQLYSLLMGPPNSGKSVAIKRVRETLNKESIAIESRIPGSEIGLSKFFEPPRDEKGKLPPGTPAPRSALLLQDELELLLKKMTIEGSTLDGTLRSLFYDDLSGGASKAGAHTMHVRLSILGGLPVETPAEFRKMFGNNTNGGFFDRCLIAPPPAEMVPIKLWKPRVGVRVPTDVILTEDVIDQFWAWTKAGTSPGQEKRRRRLQELAQRAATIAAAMHGDIRLTARCVDAALEFAAWQERVRDKGYQPSKSVNSDGAIYEDLVETFLQVANNEQLWVHFATINRQKHWNRTYGAGKMLQTRDALVKLGDLVAQPRDAAKPANGGNLTGNYMLADHFFSAYQEKLNRQIADVTNAGEFPSAASTTSEDESWLYEAED